MPKEIAFMKAKDLHFNPKNMRRFYPKDHVQEMADSILAHGGVLEPLIIVNLEGKWTVIDGNMRLAGGRLLGDRCPPLECKRVEQKEADQLLTMVTANKVRYDVDPVSEALHYKRLQEDGLSVRDISKKTGVYEVRISNRLPLAELDEPIQKLIVDEKLPADHRVATELLRLPSNIRIKLAARLAGNPNTTIKTALKACENIEAPKKNLKHPATALAGVVFRKNGKISYLRKTVKNTCVECNQYEMVNRVKAEPAWSLMVHHADKICDGCDLKEVQKVCGNCPMVQLLQELNKSGNK